jgi:hypothetical protein
MTALALVLLSIRLLAIRNPDDYAMRWRIAEAVQSATDDEHDRRILMSIARWESNYREDVADCRIRGPQSELTAWQILPRSPEERTALCVSLADDARIARSRVRESMTACAGLMDESTRLALYARGRCSSREGQRLSKTRWVK